VLSADALSSELGRRDAAAEQHDDDDRGERERRGERRRGRGRPFGGAGGAGAGGAGAGGAGGAEQPSAGAAAPSEPEPEPEQPDEEPGSGNEEPGNEQPSEPAPGQFFQPRPGMSWQIQLTGDIDLSVDAEVFDLDLFETSASDIAALHAAGRKVVCYFDTAYESYRPDSSQLEPYRGNPISGWPGQYWLDIREPAVLDVMLARIELAASKGCDAVDADDVDARSNNPGFALSAADQRGFVTRLSDAAHARGLAFGLKNALEDLESLQEAADFAVNEECFAYDECDRLTPLIAAGKAVFQIEYASGALASRAAEVCSEANALGLDTIIKRLDLDAARHACR
jgi:endo-alpha-1,4-polygalactosaminidase (GH114 family)